MGKTVIFVDYVERKRKTGSIEVDLGKDHGTVVIPPMELWSDDVFDTATAGDTVGAIVKLLGQDASDRFHAAGGNYRILSGIVRDQMGLDVGESEASPAS